MHLRVCGRGEHLLENDFFDRFRHDRVVSTSDCALEIRRAGRIDIVDVVVLLWCALDLCFLAASQGEDTIVSVTFLRHPNDSLPGIFVIHI